MKKIVIELIDKSKTVNVFTEDDNGKKKDKIVDMQSFLVGILSAVEKDELHSYISPLYEERRGVKLIQSKSFNSNSTMYVLHMKKCNQPMPIYNRFYDNVGIPALLFAVKVVNNRLTDLYTVAVKDEIITNETKIYKYPFSNVNGFNGKVCTGSNRFEPGIEDNNFKKLYEVPYQFISMPNLGAEYNNYVGTTEELFRKFNNKEFDDGLLQESPYLNYKKFIEKVGNKI